MTLNVVAEQSVVPGSDRVSSASDASAIVLDVVVPVYNEEQDLPTCVRRLHAHLRDHMPFASRIIIADNASTDATLEVARRLAEEYDNVQVRHLDLKGRGRALHTVWSESQAQVVAYMDVDLSTDLNALLPLVAPLLSGHSDVAIGSRLAKGSRVVRGPKREFISRCYNFILRNALGASFSDAQCGFKAMRTDVARELLPLIQDKGWFFDTELLVIAESASLRIHEVPVDWVDDPDSRVDIVHTAVEDLKGVWRVGKALATGELPVAALRHSLGREPLVSGVQRGFVGQLIRFGIVGLASTLAFALLYLALRPELGAQLANLVALLTTAVANTAANRAFTFGVRGSANATLHHIQGFVIFLVGWALTSGSLLFLHTMVSKDPGHHIELMVLIGANLVATLVRFVGLRWVFRHHSDAPAVGIAAAGQR